MPTVPTEPTNVESRRDITNIQPNLMLVPAAYSPRYYGGTTLREPEGYTNAKSPTYGNLTTQGVMRKRIFKTNNQNITEDKAVDLEYCLLEQLITDNAFEFAYTTGKPDTFEKCAKLISSTTVPSQF